MSLAAGSAVGPYVIDTKLGAGGMGEVYRAHDTRLKRDVAIKVISEAMAADRVAVDRFIREALAVSALNHPNIVTIHETGEIDGARYIAMELVRGRTVRELVRERMPWTQAIDVGRQAAEALAVAHATQIVHRDVKPENVMVRDDGYVKVLDFGLARIERPGGGAAETVSLATHTGLVIGTIGYMSPEQARGEPVATASDVFSLGVVLYESITGQHPFPAASPLAVLHAILGDQPVAPSRLVPDLPVTLDEIVLECLQKDARLRPTASELATRLRAAHDGSARHSAPQAAPPETPAHVVGRGDEMRALEQAWRQARSGSGLVVAIGAEAGFGKTVFVETFLARLAAADEPVRVARGRCSERLAGSEAYLPILEALESLLRNDRHGSLARVMRTVAPNWYVQVVSQPGYDPSAIREAVEAGAGSPQRMKREIVAFLEEAARLTPLVLFLDDVHWSDGATVDLLAYVVPRLPRLRVLVVAAYRPSELAHARHAFLPLKLDLQAHGTCREVSLGTLGFAALAEYSALEFPGEPLPEGFLRLVHHKTEGHPLFMADLLRDLRRRGAIVRGDRGFALAAGLPDLERDLPESARSMIQRKVDALSDSDRRLLSAAAVQGVDFDSAIVAYAIEADEEDVEEALDRLEREHALVRFIEERSCPDRTVTLAFRFAHVLYQNALYGSLRATRRATLAGAVAAALVRRWGDRSPEIAHELAVLFEAARGTLMAARYYGLAAQAAGRLFAHEEAERLAARGLSLLEPLADDAARRSVELELQMAYALAIKTNTAYSAPQVGAAYRRARELAQGVADPAHLVPVLMGLSAHYISAGEIAVCHELADTLLDVARRASNPHLTMVAEWSMGAALHHLGRLSEAHAHLGRALDLYEPAVHHPRAWEVGIEPGIFCRCERARTTMLLGFPDRAMEHMKTAEAQARALGHPQTLAFTLLFRALIHQLRREPRGVIALQPELVELCERKGIGQELLWIAPVHAWAVFELGNRDEGLAAIRRGVDNLAAHHSMLLRPYFLLVLAEALWRTNQAVEARSVIVEAEAYADRMSQRMFDAEMHRLHGEVILAHDASAHEDARRHLDRALASSREAGARWLELRAARSMAALLAWSGDPAAARALLAPLVASFTEGLDTLDVVEAKGLLETL
jgi:tetratricopeptide (TPR) repeat protein